MALYQKRNKVEGPRWGECFMCGVGPMERKFMYEVSWDDEVLGDLCDCCFSKIRSYLGHDDEENLPRYRDELPLEGWWLTEDAPDPDTPAWEKWVNDYRNCTGQFYHFSKQFSREQAAHFDRHVLGGRSDW